MSDQFLYEKLDVLKETNQLSAMPDIIEKGLSKNIVLREYQNLYVLVSLLSFESLLYLSKRQ